MLQLQQLSLGYPKRKLAQQLQSQLAPATLTALVGKNGCGKSTLLRTIAGLQSPLSGSVLIDGEDAHRMSAQERARKIALVLTDHIESVALTVRDVVALGRAPHTSLFGKLSSDDEQCISKMLRLCQIEHLSHREINSLSDGERQRTMIARALTQDTPIMMLDEPTAFLDFPSKVEVLLLLLHIAHETKKAILLSTHDLELTFQIADHLWLLSETNLIEGTTAQLAASGTLTQYFSTKTLSFDAQQLRFYLNTPRL